MPSDKTLNANEHEPLLDIRDLEVSFRIGEKLLTAVRKASFSIDAGEFVALVGESGCGKSLTSLSLMGLIQDSNAEIKGSIRFQNQELVGLAPAAWNKLRGRKIAMVFQDPMTSLTPFHTIGRQITEQIQVHLPMTRKAARARAIDLLNEAGIASPSKVIDQYPHQLSGGMRQRVGIAMALSCNPMLLIADEPTTALDMTIQAQILDLLDRLRKTHNLSILLITHDMGVVSQVAERVMVMYAGRIIEMAEKHDLLTRPRHPYTTNLLAAVPTVEGERRRRLTSIPGSPPRLDQFPSGCAFAARCALRLPVCDSVPDYIGSNRDGVACFLRQGQPSTALMGTEDKQLVH